MTTKPKLKLRQKFYAFAQELDLTVHKVGRHQVIAGDYALDLGLDDEHEPVMTFCGHQVDMAVLLDSVETA